MLLFVFFLITAYVKRKFPSSSLLFRPLVFHIVCSSLSEIPSLSHSSLQSFLLFLPSLTSFFHPLLICICSPLPSSFPLRLRSILTPMHLLRPSMDLISHKLPPPPILISPSLSLSQMTKCILTHSLCNSFNSVDSLVLRMDFLQFPPCETSTSSNEKERNTSG